MIKVNDVQANFIAWLKTQSTVTSKLTTSDEIRELEWQGAEFVYPNIRIKVSLRLEHCAPHGLDILIVVASEQKSSRQTNEIVGAIVDAVQEKSFSYTNGSVTVKYVGLRIDLVSKADREDTNIWEADINVKGQVS